VPADVTQPEVDPTEVAALLSVPPEEFVAARTARAKELRAEGRKAEAAALAKVRKPVRLVWIVGELARRHPDVAEAAAGVAEQVEEAMGGGGGMRQLLARFREVVGEVAALSDELDGSVDRLEVGLALREVLADPAAREAWVDGRLLALPGDEEVATPPDELAPRRAARKARARGRDATGADAGTDADAREEAERERQQEERAEARRLADEALEAARAEVEAARQAREEAGEALAGLEAELAELEAKVAQARDALDVAQSEVDAAEGALATAEDATARLDALPDV
jgi:hypothetical protein